MRREVFNFLQELETHEHNEPASLLVRWHFGIDGQLAAEYVRQYNELEEKLDIGVDKLMKELGL